MNKRNIINLLNVLGCGNVSIGWRTRKFIVCAPSKFGVALGEDWAIKILGKTAADYGVNQNYDLADISNGLVYQQMKVLPINTKRMKNVWKHVGCHWLDRTRIIPSLRLYFTHIATLIPVSLDGLTTCVVCYLPKDSTSWTVASCLRYYVTFRQRCQLEPTRCPYDQATWT